MPRNGYRLIELLIVVVSIAGILAACEGTGPSEDTILSSMKSDLLRLASAQEAFFSDNDDYAGRITSGAQVNGVGGSGSVSFVPGEGNVLIMTYVDAAGWKASIANPALARDPKNCGIFTGPKANAINPAMTEAGVPACW
ncbi:MAG TPA: hypothetical protein VFU03_04190 [Gemmatimonadales bacterium]|nr:hypothetical protein [Gemmatimonadales bacterium]